jgi:Nucleotidyl transferase AbiEii toxin, Type IV TA system
VGSARKTELVASGEQHSYDAFGTVDDVETGRQSLFCPKLDILPAAQRLIWEELNQIPSSFVLYGGTAMALRLGHRQSVDFDFFSNERFEPSNLLWSLGSLREARVDQRGDNTLSLVVDRSGPVRLSFFGEVGMNRIQDPDVAPDNRLQVASLLDLTATKLKTIQQRAEAKDYRDLAAAFDTGIGLAEALGAATAIFGRRFNAMAALKALTYFGDGNLPSLPTRLQDRLRTSAETLKLEAVPRIVPKSGIQRQDA